MTADTPKPPAIVFVPGLPHSAANTADRVADVLARALDNQVRGRSYSTKSDAVVTAPRGLTASKTIVSDDGSQTFQTFELDYRPRFGRRPEVPATQAVTMGALEATKYLIIGSLRLFRATFRRPRPKRLMARVQMGIGYVLVLVLFFVWLAAAYALYKAFDLPKVPFLEGLSADGARDWSIGLGAFGILSWQAMRKKILQLAAVTQQLVDYTGNRDRNRDTTCMTLDDAVAGLLDTGYTTIHVIGYSLGSLVVFDAVFPQTTSRKASSPMESIASMTTIGCPLDMVRTFYPSYMDGREDRRAAVVREPGEPPSIQWINIFNAADVFGSNLVAGDDVAEVAPEQKKARPGNVDVLDQYKASSIRYLDEELTIDQLLKSRGFRVHGEYWGEADEAHCFEPVVRLLLPPDDGDPRRGGEAGRAPDVRPNSDGVPAVLLAPGAADAAAVRVEQA